MTGLTAVALRGLNQSQENLLRSVERIADGHVSAESIVDSMVAQRDVEAQLANLKNALEVEGSVIDLLA